MADDLTSNTPPSDGSPPPHPPKSTRHGLTTPPPIDHPTEEGPNPENQVRDQDTAQVAQDVPDNDCVICPACAWQFRAIPVNVQRQLADAQQYEARAAHDLGRITGEITSELASIKASVNEIVAERDLLRQAAHTRDAQNAGLADLLAARETEITNLRKQTDALQKTNAAYVENDNLQTRSRREAENRLDRLRQRALADQEEIECLRVAVTDALINYARANERVRELERQINHPHAVPRPVHYDESGPIYKDDLDEDALRDGFLRRKRPPTGRIHIPPRPLDRDTPPGWMDPAKPPHQPKKHPIREEFDRRKLQDALNTLEPGGQPSVSLDEMRRDGFTGESADASANASGEAGPFVTGVIDVSEVADDMLIAGESDETTNKPAGDIDGR